MSQYCEEFKDVQEVVCVCLLNIIDGGFYWRGEQIQEVSYLVWVSYVYEKKLVLLLYSRGVRGISSVFFERQSSQQVGFCFQVFFLFSFRVLRYCIFVVMVDALIRGVGIRFRALQFSVWLQRVMQLWIRFCFRSRLGREQFEVKLWVEWFYVRVVGRSRVRLWVQLYSF